MTLKQLFSYASLTEIDPSFCNQLGIIDFKPDTTGRETETYLYFMNSL